MKEIIICLPKAQLYPGQNDLSPLGWAPGWDGAQSLCLVDFKSSKEVSLRTRATEIPKFKWHL